MRRHRRSIRGFTLIETLIAVAMLTAILAALATVTAQWLPNWNRGVARVQQSEALALGLERVVADIAAAEFVPPHGASKVPLFEGTELSVTFVRSAIGPNLSRGLDIVRIAEISDQRGLALVRTQGPFTPLPREGAIGNYLRLSDPVVLVRAPLRVSFAYSDLDRSWKGSWSDVERLPRAVRITLRDAASQQVLAVSTATLVHAEVAAECVVSKRPNDCGKPQPRSNTP